MKSIALITTLSLLGGTAFAEPILARILETTGSISGVTQIAPGSSIDTGAAITTGPASRLSFRSFPGAVVSFAAETKASINRIELEKSATSVTREASFRLEQGQLFFGIDKVNWETTTFEVLTPDGKVLAVKPEAPKTATAGIVEVRNRKTIIATEAGRIVFNNPNGNSITVDAGCLLTFNTSGYQVVNQTTGQISLYDAAGALTETRTANAAEIQSAIELFSGMMQLTENLIAGNVINSDLALAIRETLNTVNQELIALGYGPINTDSVGSLPSRSGSLPALTGSTGSSAANPANVAGNVKSPER